MSALKPLGRSRRAAASRVRCAVTVLALLSLLAGCGGSGEPNESTATARPASTTSQANALHVVASLKLSDGANTMVATPDTLWLLGGPSGVLTKVDPVTNTVVKEVTMPHPPGFGAFAGSLWIASLLDSAVMELDAHSGRVLRTIESTAGTPFYRPSGVAATGDDLWVLNHGDETVRSTLTHLDARTGEVIGSTDLPGHNAGGPLVAGGQLWITLTAERTVVRVDPATGRVVGSPILVDTGTCRSSSVADGDVWYTGLEADDDSCHDAGRRVDATSADLSPVIYGPGKSLYDFASLGGSVWASDVGRTIYRVDVATGEVRPSLRLGGKEASNRLLSAFDSIWVLGGETGQLTRVELS